ATRGQRMISWIASTSLGSVARMVISDTREGPIVGQRPVATSKRSRAANRLRHVVFCRLDRLDHVAPIGQSGSDRGRKGAAAAVRVRSIDSLGLVHVEGAPIEQQVGGVSLAMTTLHHHGPGAEIHDVARRLAN